MISHKVAATTRRLMEEICAEVPKSRADETRTTYSLPASARRELQLLAIELRCPLNDLVAVAVEDFLVKQGLAVDLTRPELRGRLQERKLGRTTEPAAPRQEDLKG